MIVEIEGYSASAREELVKALRISGVAKTMVKAPLAEEPMETIEKLFIPLAADKFVHAVNGGHGTEWIDTNYFGKNSVLTSMQFWTMDDILALHGTYIVFLMKDQEEAGLELQKLWNSFLLDTRCKVLRVDPRFTLDEVVKSIERYIKQ
jgi:hypothetical protein